MKKVALLIVFMVLFLFNIYLVKADDIDIEGNGQSGLSSLKCNTGNCINTIGLTIGDYTFSNTAIYGMRVTILDSTKQNVIKGPINYWATSNMLAVNKNNPYNFIKNNNYTNKKDPTGTLWKRTGLRTIDYSNDSYFLYADSLTSNDLETIISNMGLNKNTCIENNYVLKIEPIFVARHYLCYNCGNNPTVKYYSGTAREIVNMIYTQIPQSCDAVGVLNSNGFHVVTNYLTTIFDGSPDTNVDSFEKNSICNLNWHRKIYRSGSPDPLLGVGYISLKERLKPDSKTIQVCKRLSIVNDDGGWYSEPIVFQLLKKGSSNTYSVVQEGSTDPSNNKFCVNFSVDDVESYYKVRELLPDNKDDIFYVDFYTKRVEDGVGEYSDYLGTVRRGDSWNDEKYVTSNEFRPKDTSFSKYYIMVWNELSVYRLNIFKYAYERQNNNTVNINSTDYQTQFKLYHTNKNGDNNNCEGAEIEKGRFIIVTKKFDKDSVLINNLANGCYILAELDAGFHNKVHGVNKVVINKENVELASKEITEDTEEVRSKPFYIGNDSVNEVIVYNETNNTSTDTCSSRLKSIKDNYENNKNSVEAVNALKILFDEMYSEKGKYYNMLFNYDPNDVNNKSADLLNNVVCGRVQCNSKYSSSSISDSSLDSTNNFSCQQGFFEYGVNVKKDSSNSVINSRTISFDPSVSDTEKTKAYSFYQTTCDFNNQIDYYEGATCGFSYEYSNPTFVNDEISAGQLLWYKPLNNNVVGSIKMKIRCYYIGTLSNSTSKSLKFSTIIKDHLLSGNINATSLITRDNLIVNKPSLSSRIRPSTSISSNGNYFLYWDRTFDLPILYNTLRYLSPYSGLYSNKEITGYYPAGYGLPIGVDAESGNYSADLILHFAHPFSSYNTTCDFSVRNDIINPPGNSSGDSDFKNFNFNFRIIDTNNPFPGIDGNGRLTGDNWCADSRIGKKVVDDSGNIYLVGDLNGNGRIDRDDYKIDDDTFDNASLLVGDINEDGVFDKENDMEHCNSNTSDLCLLKKYGYNNSSNNYRMSNCVSDPSLNNIVNKYITGSDVHNSDSNEMPMYSFTLTPSSIKEIRDYNKSHSYANEMDLVKSDNNKYLSSFITEKLDNLLNVDNSSCYNLRHNNRWCSNN